jgi:hypothetical protein
MSESKVGSGSSKRKKIDAVDAVTAVRPGGLSGPSNRKLVVANAIPTMKTTTPKEKSK